MSADCHSSAEHDKRVDVRPNWKEQSVSVDIIGKKLQHLGTVVASDERNALEVAIKQFAVRPALRSKVTVTKVADND